MKQGIIYKAINTINNKSYIGKTIQGLKKRKSQHIYESKYNRTNSILHKAIQRYGKDNFEWVICWKGDYKLLDKKEIYYIKHYNTLVNNGYNILHGGQGGGIGENNNMYNHNLYIFYHISGTIETLTKHDFALKYNLDKRNIAGLFSKRLKSYKGWVINNNLLLETNLITMHKQYTFVHKSGIIESNVTQSYLIKKYHLNPSHICQMVLGKNKSVKGWKNAT